MSAEAFFFFFFPSDLVLYVILITERAVDSSCMLCETATEDFHHPASLKPVMIFMDLLSGVRLHACSVPFNGQLSL